MTTTPGNSPTRSTIDQTLQGFGLVPVVVLDDAADADPLAAALTAGGLPIAEVTLRTEAALSGLRRMAARGDLLVGAGTVLSPVQVDRAVEAGAAFVVSPGLSPAVVRRCAELGVPAFPGAVTATEIQAALELGITTVKFFPAETSGGVAAITALAAPFPDVRFIPTGGIDLNNLADYLRQPAVLAVGGSWMVPRAAIRGRDEHLLRQRVAEAVQFVRAHTPAH